MMIYSARRPLDNSFKWTRKRRNEGLSFYFYKNIILTSAFFSLIPYFCYSLSYFCVLMTMTFDEICFVRFENGANEMPSLNAIRQPCAYQSFHVIYSHFATKYQLAANLTTA